MVCLEMHLRLLSNALSNIVKRQCSFKRFLVKMGDNYNIKIIIYNNDNAGKMY